MYYSAGNYEAFARPLKPEGADKKTAWIIGSGLAGLSAAAFLVRDGQVPGDRITVLEELDVAGGALDGSREDQGFIIRGGREMEAHFECLWDLFHSIPSLETEGASVLDEFYWLNKRDPNLSLQRATVRQGQHMDTEGKFTLTPKAQREMSRLFLALPEQLEGKRINEVFSADFFQSNFWLYWRTMFAFQEWHSALEMKLYLHRFINHIGGMPDFSSLKFTRYNQYESLVVPLQNWLLEQGVQFQYRTEVTDVDFAISDAGRKQATHISWIREGEKGGVDLGADDLLFATIGSLTENSSAGDQHTPAQLDEARAPAWELWKRIAAKDPAGAFGRPEVFCSDIAHTKWESATITTLDGRIPEYVKRACKRDVFTGTVVTSGIVSVPDSAWLLSWTFSRQPHFHAQRPGQAVGWLYGLLVDQPGDFVKKPMGECTGEEILQEWLYHLGVPPAEIPELAATGATCVPVMMPYVTAFFMPRRHGDRPDVVPDGAANFAFIGQFAETSRDTIFTTEYSVRTAMEAVYRLVGVDRGVPEVWGSTYDVRVLLEAVSKLRDGKKLKPWWLPAWLWGRLTSAFEGTEVGVLLHRYQLL